MAITENRKARFEYTIGAEFEAGIMLLGSEVRSMRAGRASIAESYVGAEDGALYLINAHVDVMQGSLMGAAVGGHDPRRKRKLLLHKREIATLCAEIQRGGMTAVPLSLYFSDHGIVKLRLAIAKGRQEHDKRAAIKDRDWKRDKARVLSGEG